MKKTKKSIFKPITRFFKVIFRIIYRVLDLLIVTPLSKMVYRIGDAIASRNGSFDKFINNPTTLLYLSLVVALAAFFAVDLKVVHLSETEAIVLSNQIINADYNEEMASIEMTYIQGSDYDIDKGDIFNVKFLIVTETMIISNDIDGCIRGTLPININVPLLIIFIRSVIVSSASKV